MKKTRSIYRHVEEHLESNDAGTESDETEKEHAGFWIKFRPAPEGLHIMAPIFEGSLLVPPEAAVGLARELIDNAEKVLKLRGAHAAPKTTQ